MTVLYAIRGQKYLLYSGIAYIIMGISFSLTNEHSHFDWIWGGFGVVHLVIYFYQRKKGYLTIKDGVIKKNDLSFKSIKEAEIQSVRYFAGDYVLKGNGKELAVTKDLLSEEALLYFNNLLERYDTNK